MIGFKHKKLISSLAASAMIVTATLAPLPGLLPTVHALPSIPFLQVNNPAIIDMTTSTGVNGIDIMFTYECAGGNTGGTISIPANSVTQTATQSGSGQSVTLSDAASVSIRCDSTIRQVAVTISTPLNAAPYYNTGFATIVSATLTDPVGGTGHTATLSNVSMRVTL